MMYVNPRPSQDESVSPYSMYLAFIMHRGAEGGASKVAPLRHLRERQTVSETKGLVGGVNPERSNPSRICNHVYPSH